MSRCDFNYKDSNCECECTTYTHKPRPPMPRPCCCVGPQGKPGPAGPPGEADPFLSSYIEAVGTAQTVANGENIVFDIDEEALDIVGTGIEVDDSGSIFTITRPGLYHVEWSINLGDGEPPLLIGLLENGSPASAMSNITSSGNYSSGALIHVGEDDIPYTISLHNFGGSSTLVNPVVGNTAASIRILRFADGPSA